MNESMGVISPAGLSLPLTHPLSKPLNTLQGKTIGEVYNNHFKGELMFRVYREQFHAQFEGMKIVPFEELPIVYVGGDPMTQRKTAQRIAAMAKEMGCDALISGNGG
ncbi:MAG: hypothetical protein WCH96_07085 [Betaproteobacteria bacterium]|jgi:hypothetical protein